MSFYALIELMGHRRIVGFCSWRPGGMLQVEAISATGERGPTTHIGPGALFRVTPVTSEVAHLTAAHGRGVESLGMPAWAVSVAPEEPREDDIPY